MYRPAEWQKAWEKGFCDVQPFTPEMARYVCGYVTKKLTNRLDGNPYGRPLENGAWAINQEWHSHATQIQDGTRQYDATAIKRVWAPVDCIAPPYIQVSRRPGIGWRHFWTYREDYFAKDECYIDGKPRPIPNAYLRRCQELRDTLEVMESDPDVTDDQIDNWLERQHIDHADDLYAAAANADAIKHERQLAAANSQDPDAKLSGLDRLQRTENRIAYAKARAASGNKREPSD